MKKEQVLGLNWLSSERRGEGTKCSLLDAGQLLQEDAQLFEDFDVDAVEREVLVRRRADGRVAVGVRFEEERDMTEPGLVAASFHEFFVLRPIERHEQIDVQGRVQENLETSEPNMTL